MPANGRRIVAQTTIPIGGANSIADVASFGDRWALSREPKLCSHFGEAGTAIFLIQEIQYGGHNLTPSFDHRLGYCLSIVSGRLRRPRKMASSASSIVSLPEG
jgi:hypothetical protein